MPNWTAEGAAANGLWKQKRWGIALFLGIACSQLIAHLLLSDYFGSQQFLIGFHGVSITVFIVLRRKTVT